MDNKYETTAQEVLTSISDIALKKLVNFGLVSQDTQISEPHTIALGQKIDDLGSRINIIGPGDDAGELRFKAYKAKSFGQYDDLSVLFADCEGQSGDIEFFDLHTKHSTLPKDVSYETVTMADYLREASKILY